MQQEWSQQCSREIWERDIGHTPKTWSVQYSQAQTVGLPLAAFTISDGNMKEDIKVSDWSPLLVIPWQSRQLEESTSHPGSLCTQRRVSDPFREGFIPSYMDTWGRQGQSPLKGLSLYRVLLPLQRGFRPPPQIWCLLQARWEESLPKQRFQSSVISGSQLSSLFHHVLCLSALVIYVTQQRTG